jgi:CheY-like chemotaxis protein
VSQRVLIVEDEMIVADDLNWQLSQMQFDVVGIAASGEEAIVMARERSPDIVFMDIQLQGKMSGTEAAPVIQRETGAFIVFLTAFAAVFTRSRTEMPPSAICLSKPFSTVQLKSILNSALTKVGKS